MWFLLLACVTEPEPQGSDVIDPLPDDDPDPVDSGTVDSGGGDSGGDSGEDTSVVLPPVEDAPKLLINEAMSDNECSFGLDGAMPDWIELYNASFETISVDRLSMFDSAGSVWIGQGEAEIPPGGFFIVLADGQGVGDHAPFNLSRMGDTLTLLVDGQVTDRLNLGYLDEDTAWARYPDGGEWDVTLGGTPGVSNGDGPVEWQDATASLFNLDGIRQIEIGLDSAAERSLTSSPQTYVSAAVAFNGITYDPVGVRLRGSMTFQPLTGKAAFKIDMNRYADSTYCGEMKKFNVLNMYYDASLVREYMAYYIFRELGVPAARNAYAQTYVNGDYYGIELLSEAYDDVFLDNWYGYDEDVDYMIWEESSLECEEGDCDSSIINSCLSIFNSQSANEGNLSALEQCLDVDAALREIAGELTLGQWDGFCAPHNFRYAYNPVTGLIQVIPSSLDLTFDNLGYSYTSSYFQCNGSQLLDWCLDIESCEERYIGILEELADRVEGGGEGDMEIEAVMDEIYAQIEPHVASEPRGQYSYAQWADQFDYVRTYLRELPEEIRRQVDAR